MYMQVNQGEQPRWFVIWQKVMWIAFGSIGASILVDLPYLITYSRLSSNTSRVQMLENVSDNILTFTTIFFISGLLMELVLIFIGLMELVLIFIGWIINFIAHRKFLIWHRVDWQPFILRGCLMVIVTAISFWFFLSPSIGPRLQRCFYITRLIAYIDENRNSIRDTNEVGLSHVTGTVIFDQSTFYKIGNQTFSFETNSRGYANITDDVYSTCSGGAITVNFDIPNGYHPTTDVTIGPIHQQEWNNYQPMGIYAGFSQSQ
jgi:hypothetical protein